MKEDYKRDHHHEMRQNTATSKSPIKEVIEESIEKEDPVEVEAELVVRGEVANCTQVFLRSAPSFEDNMLVILNKGTEVFIDENFSDSMFYKVSVPNSVEGYIVKGFIEKR